MALVIKKHRLSLEHIAEAAKVIDPVFLNSPQFLVESLSQRLGCRLVVKVETLNPIRSFKGRGTEYLVASLTGRSHVVCATAGNFGRGMAYAARKRKLPITIFVAANANPFKVERMRAMGADVRIAEGDAALAASEFAAKNGAHLVVDGRDAAIGEGAGTIAIELLRGPEPFDAILVPLGDGSLLAGVARWVKQHHPATEMIGVCAQGAPAMERSWRSGRVQEVPRVNTIADGLEVSIPYAEAVADITGQVDDILLAEDSTMLEVMRLVHHELGIVLEPSGAAGVAALMANRERFAGKLVATILTGGNITREQIQQWLT